MLEQIDLDQRAEEEELAGRVMHPSCANYSCLSWCPDPADIDHSPDVLSAKDVNWHPPLCLRKLGRGDFVCDARNVRAVLERGIRNLDAQCQQAINDPKSMEDLERDASRFDPT